MASNNLPPPIFQIPEAQLFSDYGFDPHFNYFQVLEEARKHKRGTPATARSIDALHFKLQKPISKDHHHHHHPSTTNATAKNKTIKKKKSNTTKKRWWKNALLFFKGKWAPNTTAPNYSQDHHRLGPAAAQRALSGPVYITESRTSASSTPRRTTSRPSSGPLFPAMNNVNIPYISLGDLNSENDHHRISTTSPFPIYFVT